MTNGTDAQTTDATTTTSHCPPWCDGDQCQEPDLRDRYHQYVRQLPVVARVRQPTPAGDIVGRAEGDEATIAFFTSATDSDDELWIAIELSESGTGFTVTRESAQRIYRILGEVLTLAK